MSCPDCATGVLHGGTPTGTVSTLHGLQTYVAEPPAGEQAKGVVVIIPDAFGWELPNSRILADNYAKKGKFRVYLPEFMDGNAMDPNILEKLEAAVDKKESLLTRIPAGFNAATHFAPFLYKNRAAVTQPRIFGFLRGIRASTDLKIGVAGFCWGGKWVTILCSGEDKTEDGQKPLVDAGFTAHPSNVEIPKEYEAVQLPLSIANGTDDFGFPVEKMDIVEKIFQSPTKKDITELVRYDGAKHGFAIRGNINNEKVLQQGIEAEDQAIRWFEKWLPRA